MSPKKHKKGRKKVLPAAPKPNSGQSPYATPIPPGTYIVVNGIPVFVKREKYADHRIARSDSDSENTWKGFGYMGRDNGKFGSISGEDYAD